MYSCLVFWMSDNTVSYFISVVTTLIMWGLFASKLHKMPNCPMSCSSTYLVSCKFQTNYIWTSCPHHWHCNIRLCFHQTLFKHVHGTHTHIYIQFKSTVTLCNVSFHIWYEIVWGIITFMGFCNVFPGTNHFMGEKGGFPWNTHQFCRLRAHWNIPVWRLQGLSAHVEFHTLNGPR